MKPVRLASLAFFVLAAAVPFAHASAAPRTIELAVTDAGLVPAQVTVKAGEAIHLGITRKTDKTCMFDVVIPETGTRAALPLNKTVYADFTAAKPGTLRLLCGMNMQYGKIVVN